MHWISLTELHCNNVLRVTQSMLFTKAFKAHWRAGCIVAGQISQIFKVELACCFHGVALGYGSIIADSANDATTISQILRFIFGGFLPRNENNEMQSNGAKAPWLISSVRPQRGQFLGGSRHADAC